MTSEIFDTTAVRHVFRAYDIRGVAHTEITGGFARALGLAFACHLRETQQHPRLVALGMDNRPSSPMLHSALRDGLLSGGLGVLDLGLVSSPMIGFAVCRHRLDGGICVTGSHNSPANNGFKLERTEAFPLAEKEIERLRDLMAASCEQASNKGTCKMLETREEYLRSIRATLRIERPLRIAVDAGNGVMGLFAPDLFRQLGCDVVEIHCQPDATFPHHIPNPEDPANMRDLQEAVLATGANLGFAFDGDGDRLGVVDETGAIFDPGKTLMLLARDLLERTPGAAVLVDVKSSQTVLEDIRKHGGIPILTATGHSLIRRRMSRERILLGGEYSGHFFCAEGFYGTSDALLAAAKATALLSRSVRPLSQLLVPLPQRYTTDLVELPVREEDKQEIVSAVQQELSARYRVVTIDGVRANMGDGWALVRASNTGPRLSLRFEADSPERLAQIKSEVLSLLPAEEQSGRHA